MKKKIVLISTVITSLMLTFSSCRKETAIPTEELSEADIAAVEAQSNDNSDLEGNINSAIDDINAYSGGSNLRTETNTCSGVSYTATVTGTGKKKIRIGFNGFSCRGLQRSGSAEVTLTGTTTAFNEVGATWTVSLIDYTVTRANGQTATMNGTWNVTNVSGGYVGNGSTIVVHTVTGNVNVAFANSTSRSWTMNEKREWSADLNSLTISGIGSYGGNNDVVRYGTNRLGNAFVTRITSPIVFVKATCSGEETIKYSSGTRIHTVERERGTVTRTESISLNTSTCISTYTLKVEKNGKSKELTVNF
jgi:hypothetical protein